jgi:hypothetical protein
MDGGYEQRSVAQVEKGPVDESDRVPAAGKVVGRAQAINATVFRAGRRESFQGPIAIYIRNGEQVWGQC